MRKIILVNSENTELLEEIKNGFKQKNIEYSESDNVDFSNYTEDTENTSNEKIKEYISGLK